MKCKIEIPFGGEPGTGPVVFEPITIERRVEEHDDDFYNWAMSSFAEKQEEVPCKFDIELYRPPRSFFPLLWWNIRMFIGRLVRRVRPRPDTIFHDCYPVKMEPSVDRSDLVVTVEKLVYSERAKL